MTNRWGSNGNNQTLFWVGAALKSLQMVTAAIKLKDGWKKSYDQPKQHIKKQETLLCQ